MVGVYYRVLYNYHALSYRAGLVRLAESGVYLSSQLPCISAQHLAGLTVYCYYTGVQQSLIAA